MTYPQWNRFKHLDNSMILQASTKQGVLYLITKQGYLHLFDLHSNTIFFAMRISKNTIITAAGISQRSMIFVDNSGQVRKNLSYWRIRFLILIALSPLRPVRESICKHLLAAPLTMSLVIWYFKRNTKKATVQASSFSIDQHRMIAYVCQWNPELASKLTRRWIKSDETRRFVEDCKLISTLLFRDIPVTNRENKLDSNDPEHFYDSP